MTLATAWKWSWPNSFFLRHSPGFHLVSAFIQPLRGLDFFWAIQVKNKNWLAAFTNYMRHETMLTKYTCNKAIYVAHEWVAWLDENGIFYADACPEIAIKFMRAKTAHQAKSSVNGKLWAMKKMYDWTRAQGLARNNPFEAVTRPRVGGRTIAYVPSMHAVERLLEQPDTQQHLGIRDRACLELLYGAGIRARELLNIRLRDLNLKDQYVIVKGKGGHERLAIFGGAAQYWLGQYLVVRASIPSTTGIAGRHQLFIHRRGAMNYDMLRAMIRFYAARAGLSLISAHSLRHAFATHMYQRGADIRAIQLMLGHAHLQTTTIYAHALTHEMHDMVETHHPRGSLYNGGSQSRLATVRW